MPDVLVRYDPNCPTCKHATDHAWFGLEVGTTHCPVCHKYWTGTATCHCTVCHETFASYSSSDLHWLNPNGRPLKKGAGSKHVHPSTVRNLVQMERADGRLYWTKDPS